MNWKDALPKIITQPDTRLRFGEPLAKHTYFKIGGETTAYIEVSTIDELAALARFQSQLGSSRCSHRKRFKSISK